MWINPRLRLSVAAAILHEEALEGPMSHPDESYVAQVANAALEAIINLYHDGSQDSGLVEPEGAIEGLCVAIAMLAHNTRLSDSSDQRRKLADKCRQRLILSQNLIAEAAERGERATPIKGALVKRSN